ncbi:phage tail tube protein [Alloscardovia macacae]|uniref:Bacterial Ig-like domain, group 2 n=1 Tax=Alloscardovia macacae TaxID=1160091 RepID=A0A261F4T1_9BIFI|nr:hypothetical protein [Alloscardovia macacae]OZG54122.1 bacterial Ig-like domain, group 2 [Alloscardovia macacae]
MADTTYVSDNNVKENVKLFKESAVYLFGKDEPVGKIGKDWTPGDKKPLGYFSEDGIEIGKEAGDSTEIKGHTGATVLQMNSGGYYTVKLTALEVKKETVELYFSTTVGADGIVHVDANVQAEKKKLVIVGLDQNDNLVILYAPEVQITETESLNWKHSDLFSFGVTLRTFKADGGNGLGKADMYFYGLVKDGVAAASASSH